MRLTLHTDYALRMLIYLAAHPHGFSSIAEIGRAYRISQNHLTKVAQGLASGGYVEAVRGRNGGLRLARAPSEIHVGSVVRDMEESLALADCGSCIIAPACGLTTALDEALEAFLAVLDRHTLADLVAKRRRLATLLETNATPP